MKTPLGALEEKVDYRFRNPELLIRALTHRSWPCERGLPAPENSDNEQLEFLGDSVLGFVVSEALVVHNPALTEGQLSQWKAHLVSAAHLYDCALKLDIGVHLLLGKGEERNGGRERRNLLANALEAVIAAVYLDGGMEPARRFINQHILGRLQSPEDVAAIGKLNPKSVLQERTQALGLPPPRYVTIEAIGPDHAKVFTVEAKIGTQYVSRASGSTKKAASQQAAQLLLEQLDSPTGSVEDLQDLL